MTGEQIRQLRERLGWNREKMGEIVAEGLGREKRYSPGAVSHWENGSREPPSDVLAFLAALDGTPPELFEQMAAETPPADAGMDAVPSGEGEPVPQRRRRTPKTDELVVASSGAYAQICTQLWQMVAAGLGMMGAALGNQKLRTDALIIHNDSAELGAAYGKLAETNEAFRNFLTAGEKQGALLAVGIATGGTIAKIWDNHRSPSVPSNLYVVDGPHIPPAEASAAGEPGPLA